MNARIRVALVGLTPLVRDVVHSLVAKQTDMRVVAIGAAADLPMTEPADVYLVGVGSSETASLSERLLGEPGPPRRVVGISPDGRQAHLSELRPATVALGALSPDELLHAIRGGSRGAEGLRPTAINPGE